MSGAHEPAYAKKSPPAPGGAQGSKAPGMIPDHSGVPGHFSVHVPKAVSTTRPLMHYDTAEEWLRVFKQVPAAQMKSEDFEQAPASFEELRKADPALWPPKRPLAALAAVEPTEALAPGETAP